MFLDAVLSQQAQDRVTAAASDAAETIKDAVPHYDTAKDQIASVVESVKEAVSDGVSAILSGSKTEDKLKEGVETGAEKIEALCEEAGLFHALQSSRQLDRTFSGSAIHDGASALQ